jgi:hypothetical protein
MKLLFVMDSPEYLRFYDTVIQEFAARGHQVSLAVSHSREKKPVGLEGLRAHADRVRVLGVAPEYDGMWGDIAFRLRGIMDFVRYLHPRFAAAPALRARMKRKVLPSAYRWLDRIPSLPPGVVYGVERMLMAADRSIPTSQAIAAFLREHHPDVLLVSPLVSAGSEQVDWIKVAHAEGIRTAACIASWDNLTNKGLLRIEPDLVVVWNDAQKQEAREYHYIPEERIATTGAQLFDRWFAKEVTRDRAAFCARVGLPDTRPFLLFTGSSAFISRSNIEVPFVRRWIAAVRASADAALRDAPILVRPHPYNFHAWDPNPLTDLPAVAVYPRGSYNPIDEDSRADFFDSLYHCAAVIGVNTSAMIEAAIIGRPVFSLMSEEFAGTQEGTIHFHYLLPENGGFVRIAATVEEHVRQLGERLRDLEGARAETSRFVASFVRPHGVDRPATPLFVDAIERLAAAPARSPESTPAWAYLLRPVVLAGAFVQASVTWVQRGGLRPRVPRLLVVGAHHAGRRARHVRKALGRALTLGSARVRRRAHLANKRWQKFVIKPLRGWLG